MLLGALSGLPALAIIMVIKFFVIFQLDRYDIITSSIIEAVLNSSCDGHKKCTMASRWNCKDVSESKIFKVTKPIVQTCLLLVRIDPVDKNVSQILSASQSLCTFKMCQILCFFTRRHIFTKYAVYLQIDAVAQNVLQILSAPLSS